MQFPEVIRNNKFLLKVARSLGVTIFVGGSFHLLLITIAAIVHTKPNLLNPADFLGVKVLFPETENSTAFFILSWIVLIGFYLFVFRYEHIKKHHYIYSIREFISSISFSTKE